MATTEEKEKALEDGLVQTIFKPCAQILVRFARPQAKERLLDVGCGSGILARAAIDHQPCLDASSGFDFEPAAVDVARLVASRHRNSRKLKFWQGDARDPKAYKGPWDICVAQHVLQHAPRMLGPLRASLSQGGRAVIATWPSESSDCPAYSFLYCAAGDGDHTIGLSLDALQESMYKVGFRDVSVARVTVMTPAVEPKAFLRQYLEGKQRRPPDIEKRVAQADVKELVTKKAASRNASGSVRFEIVMHIAIADG